MERKFGLRQRPKKPLKLSNRPPRFSTEPPVGNGYNRRDTEASTTSDTEASTPQNAGTYNLHDACHYAYDLALKVVELGDAHFDENIDFSGENDSEKPPTVLGRRSEGGDARVELADLLSAAKTVRDSAYDFLREYDSKLGCKFLRADSKEVPYGDLKRCTTTCSSRYTTCIGKRNCFFFSLNSFISLSFYFLSRSIRPSARAQARTSAPPRRATYLPSTGKLQRIDVKNALSEQEKARQFDPLGLLGLFYAEFEKYSDGVPYETRSRRKDLQLVAQLCEQVGIEKAEWCIRAYFSPDLGWAKSKRLEFFSRVNVSKHLAVVAKDMQLRERRAPVSARNPLSEGQRITNLPKGFRARPRASES